MFNYEIYIHLGLHKTATTFLQNVFFPSLNKDEVLYINLRKENMEFLNYILLTNQLTYSDEKAKHLFFNKIDNYLKTKTKIVISDEQFSGSPWNDVADRKTYFDRLNNIFRHAKYILILRDEEEIVQSLYLQYIKGGGSCNWKKFLNYKKHPLTFSLKSFIDYKTYVNYIIQKSKIDYLKIMRYDLLKNEPHLFLNNILDFIGHERYEKSKIDNLATIKKNQSLTPITAKILIFFNKLCKSERQPFLLFPSKIRDAILHILLKLGNNKQSRLPIPKNIVGEFCNKIKESNNEYLNNL